MTTLIRPAAPLRFISLTLCALVLSGCPAFLLGGAATGAAGAYYFGQRTATRNTSLTEAVRASEAALQELGIVLVSKEQDGLSAALTGRGAEEKTVRIQLKKIFDDVTEIKIRVGTLGDELQSQIILQRIENYLSNPHHQSIRPALP